MGVGWGAPLLLSSFGFNLLLLHSLLNEGPPYELLPALLALLCMAEVWGAGFLLERRRSAVPLLAVAGALAEGPLVFETTPAGVREISLLPLLLSLAALPEALRSLSDLRNP